MRSYFVKRQRALVANALVVFPVPRPASARPAVPPRIAPFYFEEGLSEGMRTQVMCTASQGDPPVALSWRKDGRAVEGAASAALGVQVKDFAAYSSVLTIHSVAASHSGNYTCVVSNSAGRAEYTAALSVTGKTRDEFHDFFCYFLDVFLLPFLH